MARRRSAATRDRLRAQNEALQQAQEAELGHLPVLLQDLKLLDIKRSVIAHVKARLPFLFAGLLPMAGLVYFFGFIGVFIAVAYLGTIWGPFGAIGRRDTAKAEAAELARKIGVELPKLRADDRLAVFAVRSASKSGLVLSDHGLELNGETIGYVNEDGAFGPLAPYKHLGIILLDAEGRLVPDLTAVKDQYWVGYARGKGCSDKQITEALATLPVKAR